MRQSFRKSILANGATLVTESLPGFESLSLGVWVRAGTRHERAGEEGLSHFLEHLVFKGTAKRTALDIAVAVDRVGGEMNAFTSREYTCFHMLLLARDMRLAADIMSDVLLNSSFNDADIERERKVILQEISMVEDNPEELIHDLFFEQAFGGHPLGKPVVGYRRSIESFDRDAVFSYFRRHYAPHQMLISVAGDVSHDEVRRLLNRYLGSAPVKRPRTDGGPRSRGRVPGERRARIHAGARIHRRNLEQAHLVIGFPGVRCDDPDRYAAFLLNTYLGGGMSSSLFQEIRENRGLAYTIYSSLAPFTDTGLFSVYVATAPGAVDTCLEVTGRELARLRSRALEKRSVEILKNNLKGTILINSDSVESRMTAIAKNEMFFGRNYSLREVKRMINRVTAADLLRVARALFRPNRLIVSLMGPVRTTRPLQKIARHF